MLLNLSSKLQKNHDMTKITDEVSAIGRQARLLLPW